MTPLNSAIGYEEAAAVAKEALKEKKTIRQTVIDRGLIGDKLSLEELDRRLDVLAMAKVKPGDARKRLKRNDSAVSCDPARMTAGMASRPTDTCACLPQAGHPIAGGTRAAREYAPTIVGTPYRYICQLRLFCLVAPKE